MQCIVLLLLYVMLGCRSEYKDVTIEGRDLLYACGDCYPDFEVIRYWYHEDLGLEGKLIRIEFYDDSLDVEYGNSVGKCAICYVSFLTGDLLIGSDTTLMVKEFKVELLEDCCGE